MDNYDSNKKSLPDTSKASEMTPRQLVENTFIDMGFTDENPKDLDIVADILQLWLDHDFNDQDPDFKYTQEQYILLNDPDVQNVLSHCKQYYEPKRHLSKGDLRSILENIAEGKVTRQDYDFKNGEPISIEPTFAERISAIKLLADNADDDDSKASVQFINNIIQTDSLPVKPNMDAPKAPPDGHYSLNITEDSYKEDK